jgi:hypothetical protein
MTAGRRVTLRLLGGITASLALVFSAPVLAQNSDAPVDVTAAPPTSSETVGPSQLQNFNLQGTVTRPADRPAATQTAPAAAPPVEVRPTGPAATDPAVRTVSGPSTQTASGTQEAAASRPAPANPISPPESAAATPSLPLEVNTGPAQPGETSSAFPSAASLDGSTGFLSWPWLAALIALIGGGVFIAWSRRGRSRRYADPGRLAFAGLAPEADAAPASQPAAAPRPDPVPPRAQPAPRPDPIPPRAPADDGLIKATKLKPELNFQFVPDRAVITHREVLLQFDVVLTNSGAAPARDVLVEAKLVPAHAGQDREIAAFFQHPEATGDRMAGIPPLGKVSLKSAVRLPLDQLHSFEVEGRKLFVPLVAFNILFRSSGGEGKASASFLVGRGNDEDEKLAPFRLDLGPRIFRGLSARPHSMGLGR